MIEISRLSKSFGSTRALDNVSLTFRDGILHGIIGPAGAGKTTLLRLMISLLKQDSGEILYSTDGRRMHLSEIRRNVAYMPPRQSLYADLSVEEHLQFFAGMYGVDGKTYRDLSRRLYAVTKLEEFKDRPAGKLSGGMYKKLGLMCTLLRSPRIILLDEPTNGVDPVSRREFWNILNESVCAGVSVIMTTACMDEAERCGCVHLMESGAVIDAGEPQQLLDREGVENFDLFFIKRAEKAEKND
jgi:ABC-2 type transport system ATP-binding protein